MKKSICRRPALTLPNRRRVVASLGFAAFSSASIVVGGSAWAQDTKTPVLPPKPVDGTDQSPATIDVAATLVTLNKQALQLVRKADAALNEGDLRYAAVAYARAAMLCPKDSLLRMMLGIVLSSSTHTELALPEFRQAAKIADDDLVAALLLQGAISEHGDANEAQALFQDIHRRFAAKNGKGGLDAGVSIKRLMARAQLEADSAIVQLLLGDAYQLAEEWDHSDTAYRKAAAFAPSWSKPCLNRGLLYLAQGKIDPAIVVLTEAVRRDPGNAQARVWIGEAQLQRGHNAQAVTTLANVADSPLVPQNVRAQASIGKGRALAKQQKFAGAVQALTEARRLAPDDPTAPAALGEVQQEAGNYDAAADAYGAALRLSANSGLFDSSRPVLFRSLVTAQLSAHRPAEALATLRQAMAAAPESVALWCRLMAQAEFDQGNRVAAETDLCNALDQEERHYPFETLTTIARHNLLNEVRNLYLVQLGEVDITSENRVANSDPHAVVIHSAPSSNPHADVFDRTKSLAALASIARFENRTSDEIRYRRQITTLRSMGSDWFLLAETYDQNAALPIPARDAYQEALRLGGLSSTQKAWAQKRLATLVAPAYRP